MASAGAGGSGKGETGKTILSILHDHNTVLQCVTVVVLCALQRCSEAREGVTHSQSISDNFESSREFFI